MPKTSYYTANNRNLIRYCNRLRDVTDSQYPDQMFEAIKRFETKQFSDTLPSTRSNSLIRYRLHNETGMLQSRFRKDSIVSFTEFLLQ